MDEEKITKYSEQEIQIEGKPVAPVRIVSKDSLQTSLQEWIEKKAEAESQIEYYTDKIASCEELGVKTKAEIALQAKTDEVAEELL